MRENGCQNAILAGLLFGLLVVGCGGSGSRATLTSGKRQAHLRLSWDAVRGTNRAPIRGSDTPQTIEIEVNGDLRIIPNVIVLEDIPYSLGSPSTVTVLLADSKIANIVTHETSPRLEVTNETSSAFRTVPISREGDLGVSVAAGSSLSFRTPPATWGPYQLSNGLRGTVAGLSVTAEASVSVDAEISVDVLSGTSGYDDGRFQFFTTSTNGAGIGGAFSGPGAKIDLRSVGSDAGQNKAGFILWNHVVSGPSLIINDASLGFGF